MSVITDDSTKLAFSVYENKGVFAVLLGSGLSRSAGVPTGWEITQDLIKRVAAVQNVKDETDWVKWYWEKTGKEPNYSELLEQIAPSPAERRSILHSYIEPNDKDREQGKKTATAAHRAIAGLVQSGYVRVIITTNFDRLMENALRERGIEPTIVSTLDGLAGAEPITHSACYILKLHGDYKDARILNTESELNGYPEQYDRQLDRILDEHGLIVCGWSGEWDHALRAAFLRAPNRRYSTFWAARDGLGDGAQELANHRSACVIPISDADCFFSTLQQNVETLEQSQLRNPRSIELLVNSTKRFLTKPEHRIKLDDLFTQEAENLISLLGGSDLAPPESWGAQIFRTYLGRYEAETQILVTMCIALGRWGNGSELSLVVEIVNSLRAQAIVVQGGNRLYVDFRSFPAVVIFTGYALGLTRAERYDVLHQFFNSLINNGDAKPVRVVEGFFLWAWEGGKNWTFIEDLKKHPIPLSEYLFRLFSDWGRSVIGLTSNFELVFDRFEMLASLAYLEKYDGNRIKETLVLGEYQWMPVGRLSLRDEFSNRFVLEQLQDGKMHAALIQAGFGKGNMEFINTFSRNFEKLSKMVQGRQLTF